MLKTALFIIATLHVQPSHISSQCSHRFSSHIPYLRVFLLTVPRMSSRIWLPLGWSPLCVVFIVCVRAVFFVSSISLMCGSLRCWSAQLFSSLLFSSMLFDDFLCSVRLRVFLLVLLSAHFVSAQVPLFPLACPLLSSPHVSLICACFSALLLSCLLLFVINVYPYCVLFAVLFMFLCRIQASCPFWLYLALPL